MIFFSDPQPLKSDLQKNSTWECLNCYYFQCLHVEAYRANGNEHPRWTSRPGASTAFTHAVSCNDRSQKSGAGIHLSQVWPKCWQHNGETWQWRRRHTPKACRKTSVSTLRSIPNTEEHALMAMIIGTFNRLNPAHQRPTPIRLNRRFTPRRLRNRRTCCWKTPKTMLAWEAYFSLLATGATSRLYLEFSLQCCSKS